jgi:hypothetical protein
LKDWFADLAFTAIFQLRDVKSFLGLYSETESLRGQSPNELSGAAIGGYAKPNPLRRGR